MPTVRLMPTPESADLIELTRDIVDKELRPRVDEAERRHEFPREVFRTLGRSGLLSLPYPETYGGGGQPYEVYLQVLEEIAAAWAPQTRCIHRQGSRVEWYSSMIDWWCLKECISVKLSWHTISARRAISACGS